MDGIKAHKENIRAHAARRFRERFGEELTGKLRAGIYRQIENGHNAWRIAFTGDRLYGGSCEIWLLIDRSVSPTTTRGRFPRTSLLQTGAGGTACRYL